jgi:hypothetical protein
MALLRSSVAGMESQLTSGSVVEHLMSRLVATTGRSPSEGEVRSWKASLPVLVSDLVSAGLSDVEVLVEYQLPLTSKRVDAVLAGVDPKTGRDSYVLVELKQWHNADRFEDSGSLVHLDAYGNRPVLHPLEQVAGYANYLYDYLPGLANGDAKVVSCAYLHNATRMTVANLFDYRERPESVLFTGDQKAEFHRFLSEHLDSSSSGLEVADRLLSMRSAPSRQLLAVAADEIQKREQFVLLGEQRAAYELVMHEVAQAHRSDHKTVVVITGGPGSGKSVIALSLMGELARQGRTVLHATGSRSFTHTLRVVAGKGSTRVKSMFKYFNSFMEAEPNSLDVLILDEAHRIRETSVNRYTRKHLRTNRPQIDELMSAARVPVFLLDQHQVVKPGELGTVEEIRDYAADKGFDVREVSLDEQFRCGGSAAYIAWVQRLLGLIPGGPIEWEPDGAFAVSMVSSPEQMESRLSGKVEEGFGARMTAGYCWPWSDPDKDGRLVPDVQIGSWSRPWNVKSDRAVGGAPPSPLWATDPAGFGQVGCIYTAQGFEYDWNGVIFGPDLVWRDGHWQTVRSANKDPDFRNTKRVSDEEFHRLVLNVYKVLLTRGMIGTLIYSVDPETQALLSSLVPQDT